MSFFSQFSKNKETRPSSSLLKSAAVPTRTRASVAVTNENMLLMTTPSPFLRDSPTIGVCIPRAKQSFFVKSGASEEKPWSIIFSLAAGTWTGRHSPINAQCEPIGYYSCRWTGSIVLYARATVPVVPAARLPVLVVFYTGNTTSH